MTKKTYKVVVAFTVEAEPVAVWTAEQCAVDFVKHRIDEGYFMDQSEGPIRDWDIVSIEEEGA